MDSTSKKGGGGTALHAAAGMGHTKCVTALLRYGADVNAKSKDGMTPLIAAAGGGHLASVELLLGAKADKRVIVRGKTAVEWAKSEGHTKVADFISRWQSQNTEL